MHLFDVLDLLIRERGLEYGFEKNILRIKGLETKTFKIDYITSVREGSAVTKANVEVKTGGGDDSGDGGGDDDNMIKASEKFDFWNDIGNEIKSIAHGENLPPVEPVINPNAGLITVTATPAVLERIGNYLAKVQQTLKKQVLIDVAIIEVSLNKAHKTGVDWSKFDLAFGGGWSYGGRNNFSHGVNAEGSVGNSNTKTTDAEGTTTTVEINHSITDTNNFSFERGIDRGLNLNTSFNIPVSDMVKFLKESGDVKIVSSPKIATLNNQQALITVGDTINYKLQGGTSTSNAGSSTTGENAQSIFVGILLNILPEISDDNKVMMRINPSISTVSGNQILTAGARDIAPDTKQKKLSTVVQARDGETIVLGGLISESQGYTKSGVPILQDIPLLGKIFSSHGKNKNKSELVFVITPKILDFNKEPKPLKESLKDLGFDLALDYDKPLEQNATRSIFSKNKEAIKQ